MLLTSSVANVASLMLLNQAAGAFLSIATIIAGIYILINQGAMIQILGGIIIAYGIFDIIENIIFIKKVDNYLD